jgi:hypothetical protein
MRGRLFRDKENFLVIPSDRELSSASIPGHVRASLGPLKEEGTHDYNPSSGDPHARKVVETLLSDGYYVYKNKLNIEEKVVQGEFPK